MATVTITLSTDSTTAATIATAFAAYFNASNGFSDVNGNSLTGAALIKAVLTSEIRQVVKRYNVDQGLATTQANATTTADGLSIT